MTEERLIQAAERTKWYERNGKPIWEVPKKTGGGTRAPTITDARKYGWLPSVTMLTKIPTNFSLQQWKDEQLIKACMKQDRMPHEDDKGYANRMVSEAESYSKETAKIGSLIHAEINKWFEHGQPPSHPAAVNAIKEMARFVPNDAEWEKPHAWLELGYAGTPDVVYTDQGGHRVIADMKTTDLAKYKKPYDSWAMQIAAYCKSEKISDARQIIIDRVTGDIVVHDWSTEELGRGGLMFDALYEYWVFEKMYDPRKWKEDE